MVAPAIFNGGKIMFAGIKQLSQHPIEYQKVGNMEYMELEVYSQSINRGIVKMPSQSFPGLVLQGETLASLLKLAKSTYEISQNTSNAELIDTTRELMENIQKLVAHYEATLNKHNIPLPYSTVSTNSDTP